MFQNNVVPPHSTVMIYGKLSDIRIISPLTFSLKLMSESDGNWLRVLFQLPIDTTFVFPPCVNIQSCLRAELVEAKHWELSLVLTQHKLRKLNTKERSKSDGTIWT